MEIYKLHIFYFGQDKIFRKIAIPKLALLSKFVEFMADSFDIYKENIEDYFIWGYDENKKRWKITSQEINNALPFKRKEYNLENVCLRNKDFVAVVNHKTPYVFKVNFLESEQIEKSTQPFVIERLGEIEMF